MNEAEFHQEIDAVQRSVEDAVDASGVDIDCDAEAGVLTLSFANGSKVILSRQAPLRQLWVAARSGGFHFHRQDGRWCDERSGEELHQLLTRVCSEQAAEKVSF